MDDLTTVQGGTQDAGAVTPESTPAAAASAQDTTSAGAVTPESQPAAVEGAQKAETTAESGDTTSQEPQGSGAEGHKKTLEERVQELLAKERREFESKLAAIESERAQQEAMKPNFAPPEEIQKVRAQIPAVVQRIRQLESELELMTPEELQANADMAEEALELRDRLANARNWILQQEKARVEYGNRINQQTQQQAYHQRIQREIDDASAIDRKQNSIPDDLYQSGREFWLAESQANPLLQKQFDQIAERQGGAAAYLFAKDYVEKNMGKKQEQLIQQKEAAKLTLPPGKTSAFEFTPNPELQELKKRAESTGTIEDLAAYSAAKKRLAASV